MGIFAELPEPTTQLPRAKPIPKEKPMTRWEKFAKSKGIQKKKQDRYEYDETLGEERPRFGRHSAKNDPMQDWCVELPDNGNAKKCLMG
jgi:regulator of ribosome biosynthesis